MIRLLFPIIGFFLVSMSVVCNAAIITVDNNTPSAGDYKTLQDAHDASYDGDTIYVYPSYDAYEAITVNKKLHIIGVGFEISGSEMPATNISGIMSFKSGAEGSHIEGFSLSTVDIQANDIVIKRNNISNSYNYDNTSIVVRSNSLGILFLSNRCIYAASYTSIIEIKEYSEVYLANNIVINTSSASASYKTPTRGITILAGGNVTLMNNIIGTGTRSRLVYSEAENVYLSNNIFIGYPPKQSRKGFYNLYIGEGEFEGVGNIVAMDLSDVFVDSVNHNYHLLSDSPARGAGRNGVDMGIYDGPAPFIDGGHPALPLITKIDTDFVGSIEGGLDVKIEAKSINE